MSIAETEHKGTQLEPHHEAHQKTHPSDWTYIKVALLLEERHDLSEGVKVLFSNACPIPQDPGLVIAGKQLAPVERQSAREALDSKAA